MGDPFDSTECVIPLNMWDDGMAANIPQLCFGVIVGLRLLDRDNIKQGLGKNAHLKVRAFYSSFVISHL